MALNGSVSTNEIEGRSVTLQWTASQSITTNSSVINWQVVATGSYAYGVAVREITAKINGNQVYHTDNYGSRVSAGTVIASGSVTLSHNSDGTKTFTGYIGAAIYYQYTINTENTSTFTLDTIARASTVSISGSSFYLGDTVNITISSASSSFNHTISYSWGTLKGTIASGKTGSTSLTVQWNTSNLLSSMASMIPNETTGYGGIECKTYNGNSLIGTKTITFYGKIKDSVIPTIGDIGISVDNSGYTIINDWSSEFTSNDMAIVGISKPKLTCTATGQLSAKIKSYSVTEGTSSSTTINVNNTSLDYTQSSPINIVNYSPIDGSNYGKITYTVTAVDSRGRKASKTAQIYAYPYSEPNISSCTVERAISDSTKVNINIVWNHSSINGNNTSSCKVEWRINGSSTWNVYNDNTIENGVTSVSTTSFSESSSYEFKITVTDSLGKTASVTSRISTKEVFLDFGANGTKLGIGKIVEDEGNLVEVHEDWNFKVHGSEVLDLIKDTASSIIVNTATQTTLREAVNTLMIDSSNGNIGGFRVIYKTATLSYQSATELNGYIYCGAKVLAATATIVYTSSTPMKQVTSLVVEPGSHSTPTRCEIYAYGSGFVSGHVLSVNVIVITEPI